LFARLEGRVETIGAIDDDDVRDPRHREGSEDESADENLDMWALLFGWS
jgi:hypothetical protein